MRKLLLCGLAFAAITGCGGSDEKEMPSSPGYASTPDGTVVCKATPAAVRCQARHSPKPSKGAVSCQGGDRSAIEIKAVGGDAHLVCWSPPSQAFNAPLVGRHAGFETSAIHCSRTVDGFHCRKRGGPEFTISSEVICRGGFRVMRCDVSPDARFHMSDLPRACRVGPCRIDAPSVSHAEIHIGRASFRSDECQPAAGGGVDCPEQK